MRILHISKYYYPFIGGVENVCRDFVEKMPQHETAVVCFNEGREDVCDIVEGHKVWRVGTQLEISRQALSTHYFSILRRAIKEFQPDVIQFHWANPFPAAMLLPLIPNDVKLVLFWHMDIIKQKYLYQFIKPVERALLKRADVVCVTSPIYAEGSRPLQHFREKIRIIPLGIDMSKWQMTESDHRAVQELKNRYGGKPIVFFVGRHIQYKGLPHLIEAAKHIKSDCVVLIGGKGPLTQSLKEINERDNVKFIGFVAEEDVKIYMHAATVFAFPSVSKNEAFGLTLAESMYCRLPSVTFTIPDSGVNWVAPNEVTALECPNGDPVAYAAAIDRLIGDPALRRRLSDAGYARVRELFTVEKECECMQAVYDELQKPQI